MIKMSKKKKPESCIEPPQFTENDLAAIVEANIQILERTYYGLRRERPKNKSTQLSWSNGSKSWIVYYDTVKSNEEAELDANQILVPFSPERMKRVVCHLKPLPLYYASTESKLRGESTQKSALMIWLEGQPEELRKTELYKALEQQYWDEITEEK